MNPSFNLIDEPWIPVIWLDGKSEELGLLDTLARAHEIREVLDPSPLVTASLHRLLIAILHRVFDGPKSKAAWHDLWIAKRFREPLLKHYCSQLHDRFYLMHEEFPFYQIANLAHKQAKWRSQGRIAGREELEVLPLSWLAQEQASYQSATLFDHSLDDKGIVMTPAQAARLLVTVQNYHASGKGYKHLPVLGGRFVLVRGATLHETLTLNLVNYTADAPLPRSGEDRPSWERAMEALPPLERSPTGYLDLLTWLCRFVLLEFDRDNVRGAYLCPGYGLSTENVVDPLLSYQLTTKGWKAIGFGRDRAVWRDLVALISDRQERCKPSDNVLAFGSRAAEFPDLPSAAYLDVFGYGRGDSASEVIFWRHERVPLPLAYLRNDFFLAVLDTVLMLSEKVGDVLWQALRRLAENLLAPRSSQGEGRSADKNAVRNLQGSFPSLRHYWAALEPEFHEAFTQLPENADATLVAWAETVGRTARAAFALTANSLDGSARALKATVEAQRVLNMGLKRVLQPEGVPA